MINRLEFGEILKENEAEIQRQVDLILSDIDKGLRSSAKLGVTEIFVELPYAVSEVKTRVIQAVHAAGFEMVSKYAMSSDPAFNITAKGNCIYSIRYEA